jgi:multisite-specific tRNA:(cytosine-C5)-methyltransferase
METNKEELDHDKQTDNIQNSTTKSYKTTLRSNEEFFKFYRQQGIIPDEEFEEFSSLLATDLPSSFRIQLCLPERDRLITLMEEEYFTGIKTLIQNGEELRLPEKISFLPYTYQMEMPRLENRVYFFMNSSDQF